MPILAQSKKNQINHRLPRRIRRNNSPNLPLSRRCCRMIYGPNLPIGPRKVDLHRPGLSRLHRPGGGEDCVLDLEPQHEG